MFSKIWFGLFGAILLGLGWLGTPYVGSSYYLDRGVRSVSAGNTPKAVNDLKRAVDLNPDNVLAHRWLARAYLQLDDPERALQSIRDALELSPHNPVVQLEFGDIYDRLGDIEQAIAHYESGLVGDRQLQLTVNYLQLADRLWTDGNQEEAVTIWRDKVRGRDYGDLYANWRLAQYYAADDEVAESYRKDARYFPLESVARAPDRRLDKYQLQAIVGAVADNLWDRETLLQVIAYRVWQDQSHATENLVQALVAKDATTVNLRFYLAEIYHRRGEWQQAEIEYKQVIESDPEYAGAYLRLGMIEEAKPSRNLEAAANWYEQYNRLAPDDVLGIKKLVETYEILGKPEAVVLRDKFEAKSDNYRIVSELLGLNDGGMELGENLLSNGDFEEWQKSEPADWKWYDMTTRNPFNKAVFRGGMDTLAAITGLAAGRADGLWVQFDKSRTPARSGWWYENELELDTQANAGYVLSFFYRTEGLADQSTQIWLEHYNRYLRPTNGTWQYQVILLPESTLDGKIQPLFRIFNSGRFWIDGISVKPIETH